MRQAIQEALENNFLFDIKEQEIEKAKRDFHVAISSYLPNSSYSQDYQVIDSFKAIAMGPEKLAEGRVVRLTGDGCR